MNWKPIGDDFVLLLDHTNFVCMGPWIDFIFLMKIKMPFIK